MNRIPEHALIDRAAKGMSPEEILADLPDLEIEDIRQALRYAAMVAKDQVFPLPA